MRAAAGATRQSHLHRGRFVCQGGYAALVDVAGTDPPVACQRVQQSCRVRVQPRCRRGSHHRPADDAAAPARRWRRAVPWFPV